MAIKYAVKCTTRGTRQETTYLNGNRQFTQFEQDAHWFPVYLLDNDLASVKELLSASARLPGKISYEISFKDFPGA